MTLSVTSLIIVLLAVSHVRTEEVFTVGQTGHQYTVQILEDMSMNIDSYGKINRIVVIECGTNAIHVKELPRAVVTEIYKLTIKECELPEESLQNVIEALGAQNTTELKLSRVPLIKRENFAHASVEEVFVKNSRVASNAFEQNVKIKKIDLKNSNTNFTETSFSSSTNLEFLILTDSNISRVPQSILKTIPHLKRLKLSKNPITEITNASFEGLSSLWDLDLSLNQLTSLPEHLLRFLPSLYKLNLDGNPLKELPTNSLKGSNLSDLYIRDSTVPLTLAPRALAEMSFLDYVSLTNCSITTLPVDLLEGSNALGGINLSYNKIQDVPKNFFQNKGNLTVLSINDNRLGVLSSETFSGLINLGSLDLDQNKITEITAGTFSFMDKLTFLSIRNNGLRVVSPDALPGSIKYLHLENNQLTTLETSLMPALESLPLYNNSFSRLPLLWRDTFPALTNVDLTGNAFTQLTESDFAAVPHCSDLELTDNKIVSIVVTHHTRLPTWLWLTNSPLRCDCHMHAFAKLFQNSRTGVTAICDEPGHFKGTELRRLLLGWLTCEVECPVSCVCVVRPEWNALVVECWKRLTPEQFAGLENIRRERYGHITHNTTVKYYGY